MVTRAETIRNKTYEYLTPILRTYKDNILVKLNELFVIAYGIGDYFDKDNDTPSFYILIDMKFNKDKFVKFIEYVEQAEYYIKHYNHNRDSMVVVIKIPNEYEKAYFKFKKSKYSEMYNPEQIELFFNNKKREKTYEKLTKSNKGILHYQETLYNVFDVNMSPEDVQEHPEYDLPIEIDIQKEIFNHRKKHKK